MTTARTRLSATGATGGAVLAAAVLVIGAVGGPVPSASAQNGPGVDLYLQYDSAIVRDGDPASFRFTVTNEGTRTAQAVELRWGYQRPVQPAQPTDGGYVDMRVARPAAANCTIDQVAHLVVCHLNPLPAGRSTSVTFSATADTKGAPGTLSGAFFSVVRSSERDTYSANNGVEGGWAILAKSS